MLPESFEFTGVFACGVRCCLNMERLNYFFDAILPILVHTLLRDALGGMEKNPWHILDGEGRRKYVNRTEYRQFMKAAGCLPEQGRIFCLLVGLSGCRISEALGMRGFHVARGEVVLRSLKRRQTIYRLVQLPESLTDELLVLANKDDPQQRLWEVNRSTGYRWIKRAMCIARIIGVHACPKGLRHGFGVRHVLVGTPQPLIQKWLGHADPRTTAIYTEAGGEEEREIASRGWRV